MRLITQTVCSRPTWWATPAASASSPPPTPPASDAGEDGRSKKKRPPLTDDQIRAAHRRRMGRDFYAFIGLPSSTKDGHAPSSRALLHSAPPDERPLRVEVDEDGGHVVARPPAHALGDERVALRVEALDARVEDGAALLARQHVPEAVARKEDAGPLAAAALLQREHQLLNT